MANDSTRKEKKRRAGRPKLPKGQVKNVIALRITDAERSDYEERAEGLGLRLSDWIRERLMMSDFTKVTTEDAIRFYPNSSAARARAELETSFYSKFFEEDNNAFVFRIPTHARLAADYEHRLSKAHLKVEAL